MKIVINTAQEYREVKQVVIYLSGTYLLEDIGHFNNAYDLKLGKCD